MFVQTQVIREGRALYLLEDVPLPEGTPLAITIEIPPDDGRDKPHPAIIPATEEVEEPPIPRRQTERETLIELLGYDPDEEPERYQAEMERRRQAFLELLSSISGNSGLNDVSERHDYYLYVEPYESGRTR